MNKNTKYPIDAHGHRHCGKDPRITKDCIEVLSFRVFFDFGKKFELHWFDLKLSENTLAQTSTTQTFCQSQRKLRISKLCNSWISSAMAMAMSIYRTLCVLV